MEDKIKELEGQIESLQNNLGEMLKIQVNLIRTINLQSDAIKELSKTNELHSRAIEKIAVTIGVYN